jgi:anthranilate synthase/aminodeoxychorismate synthase-like glutamine amidotransferase
LFGVRPSRAQKRAEAGGGILTSGPIGHVSAPETGAPRRADASGGIAEFRFQKHGAVLFCELMILVIDNYDSFTYNLVQYLGELKVEMQVHRNDQISIDRIRELNPERILVSPGPCSPRESGLSNEIIREFGPKVPLFGVCLGHQCIGHTFGGNVIVNYRMMHGKTSPIKHNGKDLFEGMPNPFAATRYHSLVIQRDSLPDCLEITAETEEGEIMGVKHKEFPIWGVQFHPESILTESGRQILKNFLKLKA